MSFVAVAIGGSALIGGATSLIAGGKAAGATKDAAAASDATNRYIFDTTRSDNAPYRNVGVSALSKLAGMYGVGPNAGDTTDWESFVRSDPAAMRDWRVNHSDMSLSDYGRYYYKNDVGYHNGSVLDAQGNAAPDANPNYTGRDLTPFQTGGTSGSTNYGGFETSPGYQFRLDEGLKAIERSAAARGGVNSGATMKALNRYAQGTASSEYENYANRLAALAGVGQTANASNAQAGQAYGAQQTATNTAAGNATASSYANAGSAVNQTVGGVASAFLYGKGYGNGFGAPLPAYDPVINNYRG